MGRIKLIITTTFISLASLAQATKPQSLERAVELYRDGRWIDARLELLEVKDNIKGDNICDLEAVNYYLAMCAIELEDPYAQRYLENFEHDYPLSLHLNSVRFAKGILCCSIENYPAAKSQFAKVKYSSLTKIQQEKYNVRMGYISFMDGDYVEARGYFNAISNQSDIYHHALYYNSYIDYIQGDNAAARKGFKELLESDAYCTVVPFYLLQIEFNDGNYEQVLNNGDELYSVATPERQKELARSMAEAAFRLERYSDAIKYIDWYRDLNGEVGREESYILGFSLYREVRYAEAKKYLRSACGADDSLTQNASYHLADCYLRDGDKASASKAFAMAVNDKFSRQIAEDALFNYAKLQFELGDDKLNETINILTRYINQYPTPGERYDQAKELLIATYYNSRDYDAAYKSIKELENPDSDIRLALQRIALYRGLESYNRGDHATAIEQIEESLQVDISPKYSSIARFYLGEIDFAAGDYNSALENYNSYKISAPQEDENFALSLYSLAYTKNMLGNQGEAIGYFERFIDSSPTDTFYRADAYNRAGDIFYGRSQYDQAKDCYKHASWSRFEPRYYAMYQSAIIDGITGNYKDKIKRLKSIISNGKGSYIEPSMYELGRSYIAASDYRNGVDSHLKYISMYSTSDKYAQALSDLGLAYLNLGDRLKSLTYYDKAIKAAPQSSVAKDALLGVREIYINEGDAAGYFKYASSIGHNGDLDNMTRDSLSFTSAQRLYINSEGKSQASINALSSYINDYPQGYYNVDALYYLSDSYTKTGQNSSAISTLLQLVKKGSNQYSERVYDRLSSLCYAEGDYRQSASAYRSLYELTTRSDVKQRALKGFANATIKDGADKSIIKMSDYVIVQPKTDDKLIVYVKHAKAKSLNKLGDVNEALSIFKELSTDPHSAEGAESAYRVIEAAFSAGDLDSAEQLVFDFSKSETSQLDYLAKSFIILGDIYAVRGDNFQARATYQSIIDGYAGDDHSIIEQTQSKINKLN